MDSSTVLYDSRDLNYKSPFGCVPKGETLMLCIKIKNECKPYNVNVNFYENNIKRFSAPMESVGGDNEYNIYKVEMPLSTIGLYFYDFSYNSYDHYYMIGKGYNNIPCVNMSEHKKWQVTVYKRLFPISKDFLGKIMYQIFPDRFYKYGECDLSNKLTPFHIHENFNDIPEFRANHNGKVLNNDFYGGNLQGISKKLPYLKGLGVDIIYLNPIFLAYSNHRYDTADYKTIDPMLGTTNDFKELLDTAHSMSMKIIIDGVFSHTGDRSVYFDINNEFGRGAFNYKDSVYNSWYTFHNTPPHYDSWWGIETLPCVNELDKGFLDYLLFNEDSVIVKWIALGIDGIRLDVADELPDEFLQHLFFRAKQINKEFFILGEVWEDASNKESYGKVRKYFLGNELDSVMNYVFKGAVINLIKKFITPAQFNEIVLDIIENYPQDTLLSLMNLLSTHDTPRIINELLIENVYTLSKDEQENVHISKEEIDRNFYKVFQAVFLQFTLPGMPSIYYGDEIGMQGCGDPFCRQFFKWDDINVNIYDLYKTLAFIRKFDKNLQLGGFYPFFITDKIYSFVRNYNDKLLLCVMNLSDENQSICCPVEYQLYSNGTFMNFDGILLNPHSCGMYYIKANN